MGFRWEIMPIVMALGSIESRVTVEANLSSEYQ